MKKLKMSYQYLILLLFVISLLGCDDFRDKKIEKSWQEEVVLGDGAIIWVNRTVSYTKHPKASIGERRGISNIKSIVAIPDNGITPATPIWQTNSDEMPILLDYDLEKKTWIIIVSTLYCDAWRNKWGRPYYSYGQYIVKDNQWQLVSLDKKLIGREANMFTSITNELTSHLSKVTKEDIRKYLNSYPADSTYKTIRNIKSNCQN